MHESFLDDVYDEVTRALENGEIPDPQALSALHPELEDEVRELVRLATDISVVTPTGLPEVEGYELVRELGRGGMGSVYLAKQRSLGGRLVALKVMPHAAALTEAARTRFRNEAYALARVRHPHVVEIFEVHDDMRAPSYAMEWIDGMSLHELLGRLASRLGAAAGAAGGRRLGGAGKMELERILGRSFAARSASEIFVGWARDVVRALEAVHAAGLLHRDIKPSNVMLRASGEIVLTDFGLAKSEEQSLHTRTGAFLGTPAYASPEQLRGQTVDARSDVYGAGVTLFHLLTGELPFPGASQAEISQRVEDGRSLRVRKRAPELSSELATVLECATALDPDERYASAGALADDLERVLQRRPIHARRTPLSRRARNFVARNRRTLRANAIGAAVVLLLGVGGVLYAVHRAGIPGRVAEHVREAQLALLDPQFGDFLVAAQHGIEVLQTNTKLSHAIAQLDAALTLGERRELRATRASLRVADALVRRQVMPPEFAAEGLSQSEAFARGATEAAMRAVDALSLVDARQRLDRRCAGLIAYACGRPQDAIRAWRGLDLARPQDPLVDAALGLLYLQRGESALAWPRLERAFAHFHDVGFLGSALADSALRCGDPARALRLIPRVRTLGLQEREGVLDRIEADALFRLDRRDEARAKFEGVARRFCTPMDFESLASFHEAEGELELALAFRVRLAHRWPAVPGALTGLARVLQRTWEAQDMGQRQALLASSLESPGSFLDEIAYLRAKLDAKTAAEYGVLRELAVDAVALRELRALSRDERLRRMRSVFESAKRARPAAARKPSRARHATRLEARYAVLTPRFGIGDSQRPDVSKDGRFVAFDSTARFDAADDDASLDIFVHDRKDERTTRITKGDGRAYRRARFSPNGRFVAYYAQDGVVSVCEVFDREQRTTTRLPFRAMRVPQNVTRTELPDLQVSDAGDTVLFRLERGERYRAPLALWRTGRGIRVVFDGEIAPAYQSVLRTTTGEVFSTTLGPMETGGSAHTPSVLPIVAREDAPVRALDLGLELRFWTAVSALSPCERYLLLLSRSPRFTTIDNPQQANYFVFDLETRRLRLASVDASGAGPQAYLYHGVTTGRFTAWTSSATNWLPKGIEARKRIFVQDADTKSLSFLQADPRPCESTLASLSEDGRALAYQRRLDGADATWEIVVVRAQ